MSWEDLGVWGDLSFAVTEIGENGFNFDIFKCTHFITV